MCPILEAIQKCFMLICSTKATTEVKDGIIIFQWQMSQQVIQFPEAIPDVRRVGFMGFLISVVELFQDCFIVTVARVKGMLTDEMLAQKESAVKSKRAKRK